MNDRELLGLAAKAGGIARSRWDYEWLREQGRMVCQSDMWDPLTNDDDAIRLAYALRMGIDFDGKVIFFAEHREIWFDQWPDGMASVRRAIVCAAAEMAMSPATT